MGYRLLIIIQVGLFITISSCFGQKPVNAGEKQKFVVISGTIRDKGTGESLAGAVVYTQERSNVAMTTNSYGYYSLSLPMGSYHIVIEYLGYKTKILPVDLKVSSTISVDMEESVTNLNEVVVVGKKMNENVISNEVTTKMNIKELDHIPVIFGEKDILKTIQLLPGISPAGEGNAGFYVRGGGADENLILLDEAPVYNPSHLLGFFSTFNSDAVKDIAVYKGGFPAEYGGRLSSVVDVKMNEGNSKTFTATGGIGLIATHLTVEGPIFSDKGSFMISARRTYADLFLKLLPRHGADSTASMTSLYFYDVNIKANYELSDKDHIYLSSYFGRDNFSISNSLGLNWGNITGTLRWNHIVNNNLFSNTSLIFSQYSYNFSIAIGTATMNVLSEIQDLNFKEDFKYNLNENNQLKFGLNCIYHTFVPSKVDSNAILHIQSEDNNYAIESALYVSNEETFSPHLKATYGLRYSLFSNIGPGTIYQYDNQGNILDSSVYPKGKIFNNFGGFEPRVLVNYVINDSGSIKASYARTRQFLHLLSNSTSSTPFDLWVPTNINIKPEIADQFTIGYFRNVMNNMFETSVELYYKLMQNLIDYRNGANLILNNNVESQLVFGRGWAYGAEFLIRKRYGRLTGWVSYTLSKTMRQFNSIDNGTPYPAVQDRPNNIAIVGMYDLSPR